jgi:hypothetical protein
MNVEAGRGKREREGGREGRVWSGVCVRDDAESMFGMAYGECRMLAVWV